MWSLNPLTPFGCFTKTDYVVYGEKLGTMLSAARALMPIGRKNFSSNLLVVQSSSTFYLVTMRDIVLVA